MTGELVNVADFEAAAAEVLEAGALGYFAGGAGDEGTLRRNVAAFAEWELLPRMLVGVDEVDCSVEVLGSRLSMPVGVAPVAFQRLAHEDGEAGMARAAAAARTVMTLSTLATATPSEIAEAAPDGPRWLQLYCFRDRAVTQALVDEAVTGGFSAILLTVDAPFAGRRERDLRTAFVVDVEVPSLQAATGSDRPLSVSEAFALVDAALTWEDFGELAAGCELPVLVKGIHAPADAELALEHGASGVVVSNHGGRQLDGAPASIDMLGDVVDAVAGRGTVLMDGGVRRGTDVLAALALGADAVLVGRPALWGLAVDGERGARTVLDLLREEIRLGLALLGCRSTADLTAAHVRHRPGR